MEREYKITLKLLSGGYGKRIEHMKKVEKESPNICFSLKASSISDAEQKAYRLMLRNAKRWCKDTKHPLPSKLVENYSYKGKNAQIVDVDLSGDIWLYINGIKASLNKEVSNEH